MIDRVRECRHQNTPKPHRTTISNLWHKSWHGCSYDNTEICNLYTECHSNTNNATSNKQTSTTGTTTASLPTTNTSTTAVTKGGLRTFLASSSSWHKKLCLLAYLITQLCLYTPLMEGLSLLLKNNVKGSIPKWQRNLGLKAIGFRNSLASQPKISKEEFKVLKECRREK